MPTSVPNVVPPCRYHFLIYPSQYENERDLSLAVIYSYTCRARLSVDMISSLIFINRYSRVIPAEKYIDLFEVSTYDIQDKIDDMETSVDCSNVSNSKDKKPQ